MTMSSTCLIHVEVGTALAVTSRGPRARISRATAAGTMIVLRRLTKQIHETSATQANQR